MSQGLVLPCASCGQKNRIPPGRLGDRARCGRCQQTVHEPGAVLAVDRDDELQALLAAADVPVLIDFWAPWCGPCRAVAPEVAKVSARHAADVLVLKVNTDEVPGPPTKFGIQGIPAFVVFRNGAEVARQAGMMPFERMKAWVDGATTLM